MDQLSTSSALQPLGAREKKKLPGDSQSTSSDRNKRKHVFITRMYATHIASSLRRPPAGFHVIVAIDGKVTRTSSKSMLSGKNIVEWDDEIFLSSERSTIISFKIYASFELGPGLGNGELLHHFQMPVGEVLDRNEQLQPISFLAPNDDILPLHSSFRIMTERCTKEISASPRLPELNATCELGQLTDEGHRALLRYRQEQKHSDLDKAVEYFERVQEVCPIDHPGRSAVLFNLANCKFIDGQVNNRYSEVDVAIGLYKEALQLRTNDHPDHCATALDLSMALLCRFHKQGDESDKAEATDLLNGVMEVSVADSCEYRIGCLGLEMAEASVSVHEMDGGISQTEEVHPEDLVQTTRQALQRLSHWDPCRPTLLARLGKSLYFRFQRYSNLADIHEAIFVLEHAIELADNGFPKMPSFLSILGVSLSSRFRRLGDLADINKSISVIRKALRLTPDSHSVELAGRLNVLGWSLCHRFERLGDLKDLNRSISVFEKAGRFTPDGHIMKAALFNKLGSSLSCRFERLGDLTDLNKSISMHEEAVRFTPDSYSVKSGRLNSLGSSLCRRFDRLSDLADLNRSISVLEEAVRFTPDGHPGKSTRLKNLGTALFCRFKRLEDLADLSRSILMREEVVTLTPDDHPDKPALLNNLGDSLCYRFEYLGDLADINKSISIIEEAVHLTSDGHLYKSTMLNNLGSGLFRRFEYLGDLADLNRSISIQEEAVYFTPDGHSDKRALSINLGNSLSHRFKHLGDIVDLNRSISVLEEVVRFTPDGHPDKPVSLNNLGSSLSARFERFGDLADLNRSISMKEEGLHFTPDGHPSKPARLNNLGSSLLRCFERLGDLADLNRAISMFEEAVRSTAEGRPDKPTWLNNLGISLLSRFERLGNLADLDMSISVLEEAVHFTPDGHPKKPARLGNLGTSLLRRFQVERLGDLADLNRAISMFEEAVRSTAEGRPDKPTWLNNLGISLLSRFERLGNLADLDMSISVLEEAVRFTPDGHPAKPVWLNNLRNSLSRRFERLGDLADLNRSISIQEEAVCFTPDDHPNKQTLLSNLGESLLSRFERLGDLADLNRSIPVSEEAVRFTPDSHPAKPAWLDNLGNSLLSRFERLGDLADLDRSISVFEEAVRFTPDGHSSKPARLVNFGRSLLSHFERLGDLEDLNKSISMFEEAICFTPDSDPAKPGRLSNYGNGLFRRFEHLGDLTDFNRWVSMQEEAVRFTPDGDPHKPALLNNFGASLRHRFERLGDLADLNRSISVFEEADRFTPDGHPHKSAQLINLGQSFMARFKHSHYPPDLSAATLSFSAASCISTCPTSTRFDGVRRWISSALLQGESQTALDAYGAAISLLPQLAWLGLPLTERHRVLLDATQLPQDAVAAALDAGHPEMAVEWLEQGRSIVWAQVLQLHTPVDHLCVEHPVLAQQFQQISHQLEYAGSRGNSIFQQLPNVASNTLSLEGEIRGHHDLAVRREKLLVEIRSLPGFDQFLLPKTIEHLAALAISGPVVYLTASKQRCDALIVRADLDSVIPVPLPGFCYQDIEDSQNVLRLLLERGGLVSIPRDAVSALMLSAEKDVSRDFLDSLLEGDGDEGIDRAAKVKPQRLGEFTPEELFQQILGHLWTAVVHPVLQALGFSTPPSNPQKMTRIFWCPTGPFLFLPIHAAGLYKTPEVDVKLSDFAISSYIPTLAALAPSARKASSDHLHLVMVPQPPSDGQHGLVSVKDEMDHIRTLSAKSRFVTLQDSDGTVEDVMEKLKNTDWVHFACHGVQDPKTPLNSGLCLANDRRLRLSDVIQLSRPQGGLAFLSACETAEGDETLADESVHLAAGMLLAGYSSVIGTMWSIRDNDGPEVAKVVYEHLFRNDKVPDYTESAEALHYAIQHLRDSGAPFTAWVPFIHVGS